MFYFIDSGELHIFMNAVCFALHTRIMNHTFSSFENLQLWEQKTIFIQQKIGKKFSTILNAFFIILFVLKMVVLIMHILLYTLSKCTKIVT